MTLALGSTKCSQCLFSTGLGDIFKFLCKRKKIIASFRLGGIIPLRVKISLHSNVGCSDLWFDSLYSLASKGIQRNSQCKGVTSKLNLQKTGYSLSMFICVLLAEGAIQQTGVTVSDPIGTLHSLKHKNSSQTSIYICNATFLPKDQSPTLVTICLENDSKM